MAGESAIYKKFKAEQDAADAAYKKWEQEQWDKNGAEWTKQGYSRKTSSNNSWGSTWSFTDPKLKEKDDTDDIQKEEKVVIKKDPWYDHMKSLGYKEEALSDGTKRFTYNNNAYYNNGRASIGGKMTNYDYKTLAKAETPKSFDLEAFRKNEGITSSNYITHEGNQYLRYDPDGIGDFYVGTDGSIYQSNWFGGGLGDKLDHTVVNRDLRGPYLSNYNNLYNLISNFNVPTNKQGGTMNKVKYFQQGGLPQTLNDIQRQVEALVEAAMAGDQKATEQVNQIMEAAKAGDLKATLLAQMIQAAAQKLQGQATMNKWGSKLQYIRSLKFAKGGKHTCPACMSKGGSADENVKVAKKDVDTKTYQKLSLAKKIELDEHRLATETSSNKNGSYNISHKPSAQDSTEIKRSTMSPELSKNYAGKKECGGKAKKHYFGGWL